MISLNVKKWIFSLLILIAPIMSLAAIPEWEIISDESSLTFTGVQNGAPITGSFKRFDGEIKFDPNQLNRSSVQIFINLASISVSFMDIVTTLTSSDWLYTALYPEAIFQADHFIKLCENKYQAKGTLTIRNKTAPVTLLFSAQELSKNKARVKGSTTLKRTTFDIGQGEWADTDTVKDAVEINFTVTAVRR